MKANAGNKAGRTDTNPVAAGKSNTCARASAAVDGKLPPEKYILKLEEENRRLKLAVADLTLRNQALKSVVSKKW
jgi:hypothetical protein